MALAELCDSSGNYISEIEMGRRIPSFEKIEKIAAALQVDSFCLFIEEPGKTQEQREPITKDCLKNLPVDVKKEITSHLVSAIKKVVVESLDYNNY